MPSLGADMEEGTVLEWLVHPGDHVDKGDIVAVVKTDKADVEVEVFESGTVLDLLVPVGTKVEVGTPLATIDGVGGVSMPAPTKKPAPAPKPVQTTPPDSARRRITPHARRLAAELGVDLDHVDVGGDRAIVGDDVRAQRPAPAAEPVEPVDQATAMRRSIANLMARSKREIPHYYLHQQVDLSRALECLASLNADEPVDRRVLPAALFYKATALAARTYRELNGFWIDDAFVPSEGVHLGVAIALRGGGLIAPALHDADHLPLVDLMAALRDLSTRARAGRLRGSEMSDPTITVTNLGDQGVDAVYGVIYPPQVALVGFGKVGDRPWVDGVEVAVRPVVEMTLAADHRATDGHIGARFLATIARHLQHPEEL
jgi:pyruvate dehydrogenase E2 component (dihydrolipoamide acetyltransferase)